jgi:hypothetical protein
MVTVMALKSPALMARIGRTGAGFKRRGLRSCGAGALHIAHPENNMSIAQPLLQH